MSHLDLSAEIQDFLQIALVVTKSAGVLLITSNSQGERFQFSRGDCVPTPGLDSSTLSRVLDGETSLLNKHFRNYPFLMVHRVVFDSDKTRLVLAVMDSVERKENLVESESLEILCRQVNRSFQMAALNRHLQDFVEMQQLVVNAMPAMIAYWDKEQKCRFANSAYFEWFGFTPEMLFGKTMLEVLGENLHQKNLTYIEGALAGIPQNFERQLKRQMVGDFRHTQASYIPHVVQGEVLGFFVFVADVTERKQAELDAIKASERALEASRVKSRFLANMSHEIRTPMNGALGMIEMALSCSHDPELRDYLQSARLSVDHLFAILNDILDISKIEAGGVVLSAQPFSLREVVRNTLGALFMEARKKGLQAEVWINEKLPETVVGDAVRLRQVILNVVANAIKFTNKGSIFVSVNFCYFDGGREENSICFSVRDTGIGIPREKWDLIFDPFRQVDDSRTRQHGGTGLGLAICRELVKLMGGEISFESKLGEGSTFSFHVKMPAASAQPFSSSSDNSVIFTKPQEQASRPMHVLLAEDDAVSVRFIQLALGKMNCDVVVARDGERAFEMARSQKFDLILLDMQMPLLDGVDVARKIRALEDTKKSQVFLVALTANATEEDRNLCLNAGMDDFLTKPIPLGRLRKMIEFYRTNLSRMTL